MERLLRGPSGVMLQVVLESDAKAEPHVLKVALRAFRPGALQVQRLGLRAEQMFEKVWILQHRVIKVSRQVSWPVR